MRAMLLQQVPGADGSSLATDVYLPDGPGAFPVLLTRTPYHRSGLAGQAQNFTEWGYAHVIQDVRGKYDSTGTFRPLWDEAADGAVTLDWIANQGWCNGRIGMIGDSYLGIVQIPAASCGHPALRCIAPGVAPNSFFIDWLRYDGCFALANAVRWSMTHAACKTMPADEHFTWQELWAQPTLDDVFRRAGYDCAALREWVEHDCYDEYWRQVDQHEMYSKVRVPGFHTAGWFDHISRGQSQAYRGIRDKGQGEFARAHQRLLVGPWGHMTIGKQQYGEWDFGPEAAMDVKSCKRRFVDLWMKDIDDGISQEPPVKVFVMGVNRWMGFQGWPPEGRLEAWHLRSDGAARGIGGGGRLSRESADADPPDRYRYDPADPVPTLGGPIYWGMSQVAALGPVDQRPILERTDVLYYRSERLERPLPVVGEVHLELWIASDAADTDFIAKLCVVEPPGRVICLAIGSLRCRYRNGWDKCQPLGKDSAAAIRIQMGNLAYVFGEGSRIALIVTSSSYPRILPHPNTMAPSWQERSPRPAGQSVLHDRRHASRLLLPVIEL